MRKLYPSCSVLLLLLSFCVSGFAQTISDIDENTAQEVKRLQARNDIAPNGVATINGANYDVKYHRFNIRINPDTPAGRYIKGNLTTYFKTKSSNFSLLKFDFSSSLTVDSVRYHGSKLSAGNVVEQVDTLKITLPSPLANNILDSVTIFYKGAPPVQGGGFGYVLSTHGTAPVRNYVYVLAEPYYARDWFPCKMDMYDKIDSFDMFVSVPSGFKAAGNGILVSTTVSGSDLIYYWKHRYPIAAYLITTAVANYDEYVNGPANINGTNTPMFHYVFPEHNTAIARANFDKTKVFVETLSSNSLLGDYPFKNEKYGNFDMGYSGMENQTFTGLIYSKFDDVNDWTTNAHETAHQWFGDKVTCGSWSHIWVNEGFARYLELVAAEFSPLSLNPNLATRRSQIKTTALGTTTETTYRPDTSSVGTIFVSHVYERGAMILGMLRLRMGDTDFFQGLRNYLNDPALAYKAAVTSDLQAHMEAVHGSSLNEFFTDWIYGRGVPTNAVQWARIGNRMHFQVVQTQSSGSTVSHFEMPVQVRIQGSGAGQDITVTIYDKNGTLTDNGEFAGTWATYGARRIFYDLPFTPTNPVTVTFDPNNILLSNGSTAFNSILPIDGLEFNAIKRGEAVEIGWNFAKSDYVAFFEIEKSTDGTNFTKHSTVAFSTSQKSYRIWDKNLVDENNYYRLKTIFTDGTYSYSEIKLVKFNHTDRLKITPNPVKEEATIYLSADIRRLASVLEIYTISGILVKRTTIRAGAVIIKVDVKELPVGMYTINVSNGKTIVTEKILIKR